MNAKLIAIAALSTLAAAGAQAYQGEQNPLPPQPFMSTASRAQVQTEARTPIQVNNGGTGVLVIRQSTTDRASVRAAAAAAVRSDSIGEGELGRPTL